MEKQEEKAKGHTSVGFQIWVKPMLDIVWGRGERKRGTLYCTLDTSFDLDQGKINQINLTV